MKTKCFNNTDLFLKILTNVLIIVVTFESPAAIAIDVQPLQLEVSPEQQRVDKQWWM